MRRMGVVRCHAQSIILRRNGPYVSRIRPGPFDPGPDVVGWACYLQFKALVQLETEGPWCMPVKIWTVTCRVAYRERFTFALGRVRCETDTRPMPTGRRPQRRTFSSLTLSCLPSSRSTAYRPASRSNDLICAHFPLYCACDSPSSTAHVPLGRITLAGASDAHLPSTRTTYLQDGGMGWNAKQQGLTKATPTDRPS